MITLKGMTWNHARGYDSMTAVSRAFSALHPNIRLEWDARSLQEFEDVPVRVLAQHYDLMMIDHPHVGEAVGEGALAAMTDWLDAEFLQDQQANSVGPGYATYNWEGKQWALAVDAAAQVCAWRPDCLPVSLPRSWDDVVCLSRSLPDGHTMALPLVPTHAFSSFITLNANLGGPDFWQRETAIRKESGCEAFRILQALADAADPRSFSMDPIDLLDAMTAEECSAAKIIYTPLVYGYSNYARRGYRAHSLRFGNIPSATDQPRGSMIGGVGIAVSAFSTTIPHAMAFAQFLASPECQCGILYTGGGQPGHLLAWHNEANNADCNDFFSNTLQTLELAYVRPRRPGYCLFQQRAGALLHQALRDKTDPERLVTAFNALYASLVESAS